MATLKASEQDGGEHFGAAIDMVSGRIVVGAPLWDNPKDAGEALYADHGRAFVFEGSDSTWTRVARLTADGGLPEAEAVSATILCRLATLWFAVALGAVAMTRSR